MTPWTTTLISSFISAVISAAISGVFVTHLNRMLDRRQHELIDNKKNKDKMLDTYHLLVLQGIIASLSLGEATADAVESGEYSNKQIQSREYAEKVRCDLQDFAYEHSTRNLNK